MSGDDSTSNVMRLADLPPGTLTAVLSKFGLKLRVSAASTPIPGSYWGDSEAGLIDNLLYARSDTPVHSILHECCHYICMTAKRRAGLHTDAGGDHDEENAVCYLQILLADQIHAMGKERMLSDMDAWGYSFRLGSARQWFEHDADDPRCQLQAWELTDANGQPTGQIRN